MCGPIGETMWIVNSSRSTLVAHRFADPEHLPDLDWNVYEAKPLSIWSDGTHMWILDAQFGNIRAYRIADRQRVPEFDIPRTEHRDENSQGKPVAIWSNGETMWVSVFDYRADNSDPRKSKIYAYNMPSTTPTP